MATTITREEAIELLCRKVEEVLGNNDWPTEEGRMNEDGSPNPVEELIARARGAQ